MATATPTGLKLTPGVESLAVSWGVSGEGLGGFLLHYRAKGTTTWATVTLASTVRSYVITGLQAETYEVQVRALVAGGLASASGTPESKPVEPPPVEPPTSGSIVLTKLTAPSWSSEAVPVFADGFAGTKLSDLWLPDRGNPGIQTGFNSDELQAMSDKQVAVDDEGLQLTAEYKPGAGHFYSKTQNVLSGCVSTSGKFQVEPGDGGAWAFQWLARFPINTAETDLGFWLNGPPYPNSEIDLIETGGWGSYNTLTSNWSKAALYTAMIGSLSGDVFNQIGAMGIDPSDGFHLWTVEITADNHMSAWVDNKPISGLQHIGPGKPGGKLSLIISYCMREHGGGNGFGPTSSPRKLTVRSFAAYRPKAFVGKGYVNGGIAPGTVV